MLNSDEIIFIIYFIIAIYISIYFSKKTIYNFDNNNFKNYEIVVSRYNEDVNWLKEYPFNHFKITCYNKGPNAPSKDCITPNCNIKNLPNVGRESHTYLHHIIENYNNLAPVTIFIPGSCVSASYKYDIFLNIIDLVHKSNNSVFYGSSFNNVQMDNYNFTIDAYYNPNGNKENQNINSEQLLKLSPVRPYGKWYERCFGDVVVKVVCYFGIFAVSREHIQQHVKQRYINLMDYINDHSNPEVGHYMERSWGAVFYPYPESCVYYSKKEK
jgi:uncharacterized protein YxeA